MMVLIYLFYSFAAFQFPTEIGDCSSLEKVQDSRVIFYKLLKNFSVLYLSQCFYNRKHWQGNMKYNQRKKKLP